MNLKEDINKFSDRSSRFGSLNVAVEEKAIWDIINHRNCRSRGRSTVEFSKFFADIHCTIISPLEKCDHGRKLKSKVRIHLDH